MTFPSPDLPRLFFVNMNVGPHKRKLMQGESTADTEYETVYAKERKEAIRSILTDQKPTVLFVQEFTWSGLHGRAFTPESSQYINRHYKFCGNNDSGFIYNEMDIHCERLDLKSSVRRTYGLLISHESFDTYFYLPRLCICKIKSVGRLQFELLCACWHGPHNRFSDETKKDHLRSLLKFLMKIKVECGNLPLLIGGDFNLKSCEIKGICNEISDEVQLGDNSEGIMLWIHCSGFRKKFEIQEGMISPEEASFDHPVLTMEVKVTSPIEDFKRQYEISQSLCRTVYEVRMTDNFEYWLSISATGQYKDPQMISASWHGAYDEYSDEAKEDSIRGTLAFLLREIQSHLAKNENLFQGYVQLDFKGVSKGEPVKENIHSRRNTLDTWTMRIKNPFISEVNHENQSILESDNKIIYLPPMSTPHQCPGISCTINDCPPRDCPPHLCPPHYCSPPLSSPDERHVENATPVDIHMEVVNMVLPLSESYVRTVNGYLKKCIYLQSKSPE